MQEINRHKEGLGKEGPLLIIIGTPYTSRG
jgi:hypothetical protein